MNLDSDRKKGVVKISIFITSIFVIFLSISYAFINQTLVGTKKQVITAGNLQLNLTEGDSITLENALPMYDEVGMTQKAFTFSLENTITTPTNYVLKLVDVTPTGSDKLDTSIVKCGLEKNGVSTIKLLSSFRKNVLDQGKIEGNETIDYSLRLWIDSSVKDETLLKNKSLSYKVQVEIQQEAGSADMKPRGTLRTIQYHVPWNTPGCDDIFCSSEYGGSVTTLIFENQINIPDTIEKDRVLDMSEEQNGSIVAFVEGDTMYVQGENGMYANPDSSFLFVDFGFLQTIEGLEYLDTSKVTSMSDMFYNCSNLTNLDLSSFDTSKVTSMMEMFYGCASLTSLDLSGFDTSNVTYMDGMFGNGVGSEIPDSCRILVKDEAMKSWLLEHASSLTNVVVKSS